MADALRQRADLLADLARLRAADAGIEEARAAMAPKLLIDSNVQGNLGRISVDGGPYESVTQPQAGLFLRFEWPLYQGGLRQNRVLMAQSRRAASEDALAAASSAAMREVASAYDQVQTGLSQDRRRRRTAGGRAKRVRRDKRSVRPRHRPIPRRGQCGNALAAARATLARAHAQVLVDAAGLAFAAGELTSSASPALAGSPP